MTYTGIYSKGIEYRFKITQGLLGSRSFMLIRNDIDPGLEPKSQVYLISGKSKNIDRSWIVAHIITDNKLNIKHGFGDMELIKAFLEDVAKSEILSKEFKTDESSTASIIDHYEYFEVNNGSIEIYYVCYNEISAKKLSGLEYFEFTATDLKRSDLTVYAKTGRVRSLKQLQEIYDLSWILSPTGRLLRDYRSVRTEEALKEVLTGIESHDIISLDFETTTTEFYYCMKSWSKEEQPKIVGIGISWEEGTARYIPLISNKFECLPYEETLNTVLRALSTKKLIGANHIFDFGVAYYFGYLFECVWDVMQAEFDIDPTGSRGHKKLKELTRYYAGWETLELDEVLGGPVDGRLIPELDEEVILIYGGADVDTAWTVMNAQKPYMKGKETIWRIDMAMIPIIAIEDFYGCKMDMEVWKILNEINSIDKSNVEKSIWSYLEEKVAWKAVKEMHQQFGYGELTNSDIIEILETQPEIKTASLELLMKGQGKNRKRLQLSSVKDLLFIFSEILHYPIYTDYSGKVSFNDEYLYKLSRVEATEHEIFFKEDLKSHSTTFDIPWVKNLPDDEKIILSKDELENCAYPFCIMLKEWRKLDKRDNSFLAPIRDTTIDGWYNRNTKMTAADTARFINPTQTLQGYMKKLDIAYDSSRYFVQFDLAQIEFRVMIGNAVRYWEKYCKALPNSEEFNILREKSISHLVDKLNIPWTDYHREGGSAIVGTTPAKMTKAERNKVKSTHFAVPYGAEAYTVAKPKLLNAQDEAEKRQILTDTEETLMIWKRTMFPLHKYLETKRDIALQPLPDSELPPRLKGGQWGRVVNTLGRCRYYNLDYVDINNKRLCQDGKMELVLNPNCAEYREALAKTTKRVKGSIRRSAGNYPIQSDAREYFAMIMIKLFKYCKKHGLSGTGSYDTDKIIQSLMIHDENHLQVSKDIHPFKIYQILLENCLLELDSYPAFYMGIAVCDSWYESKDDKYEAPVQFVRDIVKKYKANPEKFENEPWRESPKEYVLEYIKKWMDNACDEFIQENTVNNVFDVIRFRSENENYFFLTKPVLYTRKFTNTEGDITSAELALLSHNKNPNLIIHTDIRDIYFKDYVWEYPSTTEDKIKETSLFTEDKENTENLDFDDFSVDDFKDLFDEDVQEMKDKDADACYWLYSEAERELNTNAELENISSDIDITQEIPVVEHKFTGMVCINDTWILDIRDISQDTFKTVAQFLNQYKSEKGLPVILKSNEGSKMIKSRYSRNVDILGLQLIMEKGC